MDDLAASPVGKAQKELLTVPIGFYTDIYQRKEPADMCLPGLISMFLPKLHGIGRESISHLVI